MAHDRWAHHIWCNFAGAGPTEDCNQCKGLREKYPENGMDPIELAAKHFPDAIPRTTLSGGSEHE